MRVSGLRAYGLRFRVQGSWFGAKGVGIKVQGLSFGLLADGFGFSV